MLFQCKCGNTSKALGKSFRDDHQVHDVPKFLLVSLEDNEIGIQCTECQAFIHLESHTLTREELEGIGEYAKNL